MDRINTKPGFAFRAGQLMGTALLRCTALERRLTIWCVGGGMNPVLCRWVLRILKSGLIALVLYLSFWIAAVIFGLWLLRGMAELGLMSDFRSNDEVGFDTEGLFPDPYSQDNIHDPVFDHENL
ncbi:DUF3742 family protein [Pseudomonas sp. DWP3-1-2]|uniref:DUF3742 family protein n=1 Tax=Pseudomonas sp. DWP3-1-2 TaxID=2804645 RepID=UPI003CE99311